MADEVVPSADTTAVTTADAVTGPEPKRRGGRRRKATTDMMGGMSVSKATRATRKRAKPTDGVSPKSTSPDSSKAVVKRDGRKPRAKRSEAPAAAPVTAIDEMADLIQLEQENQRLRKALSEKLRAENADLRRRLGLG